MAAVAEEEVVAAAVVVVAVVAVVVAAGVDRDRKFCSPFWHFFFFSSFSLSLSLSLSLNGREFQNSCDCVWLAGSNPADAENPGGIKGSREPVESLASPWEEEAILPEKMMSNIPPGR